MRMDASTLSHPDIYGLLVMIDHMALSSTWICGKFLDFVPASFFWGEMQYFVTEYMTGHRAGVPNSIVLISLNSVWELIH